MTKAETILWFSMAVLFSAAACYAVRGLLGETVRVGKKTKQKKIRRRVTWALLGLSAVLFVLGAGSLWGAMAVSDWFGSFRGGGQNGVQNIVAAVSSGLLVPCAVLLTIGIMGDRAKDKPRCPKCWYDMSAGGDRCPECGREIEKASDLLKTRRRRWPIVMACVLLAASAYTFTHLERVIQVGWTGAIPTTVLSLGWRVLPESLIFSTLNDDSLTTRIKLDNSNPLLLKWGTSRVLRGNGSLNDIKRALSIRFEMHWARSQTVPYGSSASRSTKLLSGAEAFALSEYLLSYPKAGRTAQVDAQLEAILTLFAQLDGQLTDAQWTGVMEAMARGEDVPKIALELCMYSVDIYDKARMDPAWAAACWRAFEGHQFVLGDERLWILGVQLGSASFGWPKETDRLILETSNPDGARRFLALMATQYAARGDDEINDRLWSRITAALADPEPMIRNWAGLRVIYGRQDGKPADGAALSRVVDLLASDAPDRAGLIPEPMYGNVPDEIVLAIANAISDPDPAVADRALWFIDNWSWGNSSEQILKTVLGVLDTLDDEMIPAEQRDTIREKLEYKLEWYIDP